MYMKVDYLQNIIIIPYYQNLVRDNKNNLTRPNYKRRFSRTGHKFQAHKVFAGWRDGLPE